MKYFVTLHGEEMFSNLTKKEAINKANKLYEKVNNTLSIGIGKIKYIKGAKYYTCLPLHFYND